MGPTCLSGCIPAFEAYSSSTTGQYRRFGSISRTSSHTSRPATCSTSEADYDCRCTSSSHQHQQRTRDHVSSSSHRGSSRCPSSHTGNTGSSSSSSSSRTRTRHLATNNLLRVLVVLTWITALPGSEAIATRYCAAGQSLEGPLCYERCKMGWAPLMCSCVNGRQAYKRACGAKPQVCQAKGFTKPLPPVTDRSPFTLVMTADPQLFRDDGDVRAVASSLKLNKNLVQAANNVAQLGTWPLEVGGGTVEEPRSLVMLGDMTELWKIEEADGFRHFYDPSFPRDKGEEYIKYPTWLMLGNHDYVNPVGTCTGFENKDACVRVAIEQMRAALAPGCNNSVFTGLPKQNITSLHIQSMSYSFSYGNYYFIVLQHNPRYRLDQFQVAPSMTWLAKELARATAQQRKIVLLFHAHKELYLQYEPSYRGLIQGSNVVAIFYGHIHIKPWGYAGNFFNTSIPTFNCGASWFSVMCLVEFSEGGFRVGAVVNYGDGQPKWWGGLTSHAHRGAQRTKPVLHVFVPNPSQDVPRSSVQRYSCWHAGLLAVAVAAMLQALL